MSGCVSIAGIAMLCYAVSVGPWFAFPQHERAGLAYSVGLGAALASLVGAIAASRLKLAGIVGFTGGSLSAGVFQYLRLNHAFAAIQDPDTPTPEYSHAAVFLVPLGWVLYVAAATAILVWISRSALHED